MRWKALRWRKSHILGVGTGHYGLLVRNMGFGQTEMGSHPISAVWLLGPPSEPQLLLLLNGVNHNSWLTTNRCLLSAWTVFKHFTCIKLIHFVLTTS